MRNIISILLFAAVVSACNGGRMPAEDATAGDAADADPYAEARALFEARQQLRRRAEGES